MRLDANEGPTDIDRRHNLVLSGSAVVPRTGGLTVATVVRALSGRPFTLHDTKVDADRNGVLFDPLPAGTYSGTRSPTPSPSRTPAAATARAVPASSRRTCAWATASVSGSGGSTCSARCSTSPTGPTSTYAANGDRRSTNFLTYIALRAGAAPRTGQVGVRFAF